MTIQEIQDLKTFFSAIKVSGQSLEQIQGLTPGRKAHCLQLLRELPQFQGDKFKDDNVFFNYLREYLKNEGNRKFLAGKFKEGRIELEEALEEEPVAGEVVSEQPGGQTAPGGQEAPLPAGESTSMAGGIPNIPSAPYSRSTPRIIRNIPPAPQPTPGQTTSSGASAKVTMTNPTVSSTTTSSSGLSGNRTFNLSPKTPESLKTLESNAGIGIKKGLTGIGRGLGSVFGDVAGRGIRAAGRMGMAGLDSITMSRFGTGGSLVGKGASRRFGFLFFGAIGLLFIFGTAFSLLGANNGGGSTTGGGTPTGGGGLDYTIPFKDPSVRPLDIKDQVRAQWSNAQLQNWDTIVQQSIAAGWNPAFVLALWIEETGAQGVPNYSDPLGCAPRQPTTDINLSLRCLFNNFGSYTNNQFADFMCRYSEGLGKPAPCQFITNPHFPAGVKTWYSLLVPSGPGAITLLPSPSPSIAYTPGGGSGIISCPVNGGTVRYGSKGVGGHCSAGYNFECIAPGQPGYTGRDTAVDVTGSDRTVFLPNLGGQPAEWTIDESGTAINDSEGGGIAVAATASHNGKPYRIRFVHIESTSLRVGQKANSATPVGQHTVPTRDKPRNANHVHITLQEDGVYKPADSYFNLCQ